MAKAVKKPRKKATNGYKMPEPLPKDEVLIDILKKPWKLGPSIGKGGFGEIYSAQELAAKSKKYPYVIKIEPHENGPLFVEMHFYMKNAKPADIDEFRKVHKLKTFGMPAYLGSGSHEVGSNKYRFIVMERFGTDIDKLRKENSDAFPVPVAFQLAWQMTYVLEYIHKLGYIHADIKGANMLLGITPETKNQAYLVDFGLATKFSTEKEFKPNPKKAHDGTIEYLSRDAHLGVPTRRGDLEILGYNIIHWLGGKLPWEKYLSNTKHVQEGKEEEMKDIPNFVKTCFNSIKISGTDTVVQFLKYVNTLKFNQEPDYKKIRDMFKKEVEKNGCKVDGVLDLHPRRKRRSLGEEVEVPDKKTKGDDEEIAEKVVRKKTTRRKKEQQEEEDELHNNDRTAVVKQKKTTRKKKEVEDLGEGSSKEVVNKVRMMTRRKKDIEENDDSSSSEEVMNDAMKEVLHKKMRNVTTRKQAINKDTITDGNENLKGYTAEMLAIKTKIENGKKGKNKKKPEVNSDQSEDKISTRLRRNKHS